MRDDVQTYYGETLQKSEDLQTNACCTAGAPPPHLREVMAKIHPDVSSRYYGCGLLAPEALTGLKVLDLGCGAGQDVYVLSALVGESGSVTGVDMTPQQLAVAQSQQQYHTDAFGYKKSNVRFIEGELEHLDQLDLEAGSFDLIVSNCVINLCEDKHAVLKNAYNLLKRGGEMYFSDVYSNRRIPSHLQKDPVLFGECLSGAFYWNDFLNCAKSCGFLDPRLVEDAPIEIQNAELEAKLEGYAFYSATYRLFKLDNLEPACEDYGQAVIYQGTIDNSANMFVLDKHHLMEAGKVFPVCGNTFRMLHDSRLAQHFQFIGNWDKHFGIFEGCGSDLPFDEGIHFGSSGSCC